MAERRAARSKPHVTFGEQGVVGNMETTALVSLSGSVDFMCYPRVDSPTVFAALLDPARGGHFSIAPHTAATNIKQMYLPETNVLLTRFMSDEGVCELIDLMPVTDDGPRTADAAPNCLIRMVRMVYGTMTISLDCAPRFDYAQRGHRARLGDTGHTAEFTIDDASDDNPDSTAPTVDMLALKASVPLSLHHDDARAQFELNQGETACFVLGDARTLDNYTFDFDTMLADTTAFWRTWSVRSTYRGRYREIVMRSALTLKLLSSREHGAIVAAATFGLPESQNGTRRWDYRFTWIRDAAFSVYALLRLGYTGEAAHFMRWIGARNRDCASDGALRAMYTVDGEPAPEEADLDALLDKRDKNRARRGNGARDQIQLDVYGALLDAAYLFNKYGRAISYDGWCNVTRIVNYVVDHWQEPDHGIWEFRNGQRPLLHSRLMCWVTVDRALRLADKRSLPAPLKTWFETRDAIHRDIHENFWNSARKSFVQTPESDALDASILMMPLVRFISSTDPRWVSTLDAIGRELSVDPLIFRYTRGDNLDGLPGVEGGFSACSFWYAEALARAGRIDEGRLVFEKMIAHANHLGLFSEEVAIDGEPLGNFPQALTHLALISAAYQLDRSIDGVHVPWT
ncbi:glycoside hydrolase family 15 protein [Paraburkholderia sp.]|uniref:glycoside hydrolase family 15 protein n=1 Tax=Paraburkholderia sp. TaxID=1926495 RepID=UPI00239A95B0|nr:glycoside hydrolase family 15 protein [Paraburkholderia sp.]MDE1182527.1 glycoside hydrolase family 15 protein [Paraburkholderia sp.]